MWKDEQPCQRLFKAAGWPAYFPLRQASVDEGNVAAVFRVGMEELQHRRRELDEAEQKQGIQEGSRCLANAWIEFTGWPTHLRGFPRRDLLRFTRPANGEKEKEEEEAECEEEQGLGEACNAMRRLIRKAFRTCQPEVVGRSALEFVNRRETGARTNEVPFYSKQKVPTVRKYSQRLVVILRYLWRTYERKRRPPYKLTGTQYMRMWMLQQTARSGDRAKTEEYCLRFWIALLDHPLSGDEHESGLLSGLAILGVKPEQQGGGWVPAHEYSQTLSALITTSRALVVHCAHVLREEGLRREEKVATAFELVKDMVRRFMTLTEFDGKPSPMNRMLHMRTYAYATAKETMTGGRVSWDRDRLLIDKQSFTLADLQSMAKGLYETVRLQLLRDILLLDVDERGEVRPGTTPLPSLSLDKLVDQPAEMAKGWTFLKHPENGLASWDDWLFNRVLTEPRLRQRFVHGIDHTQPPPRIQWQDRAVAEYMRDVRKFKEGQFVLVHISGGAPARGSEITSIQCENGEEGIGYRGIFAEGGLLSFTTTYHKGYSLSKRVKTIHRYVPEEVGEVVVYYLGLGRPFVNDLQMLHGGVTRRTAFMWEPEPEEEWDSGSECGEEGACGADSEGEDEERSNKEAANPDGFWGTDRTRRVMREQTSRYLHAILSTSTWRHAYPAIHRELARDGRVVETLDMVYYDREPVGRSDARAKQAGHSRTTEETVYGRALVESPFQTMAEREEFRRVSTDWHRILGFASAWREGCVHPATRSQMLAQQEEEERRRWATLASVDLATQLKQLVGRPDAVFRSAQKAGLEAIVQRKPRVLVVMGTGCGKSMLFMLPAAASQDGGVTIVIVPLTALRADLKDRCDRLGIRCAEWDGRRPPYWASIVLVTPESAITKAFGRFIDEKRTMRQLDRIVLDECHVLTESTPDWRPDLLKLTEMTEKDTQVVYLTATLPPSRESAFFEAAGLDRRDVTCCRDRTTRVNIEYQVQDYARDTLDTTLLQLVDRKRKQYPPAAQTIVYCRSVAETKRLAKVLECTAFYRDVGTEEEKARMVRRFTSGEEKLVTATPALGLGLDAAGVRVVIHVSMCELIRQYVQESGRAGRKGFKSEAIVLRACWKEKHGTIRKEGGRRLEPPVKEFLDDGQCRRISIDKEMDGRTDRQRCEPGEEKCDFCQLHPGGLKRAAAEEAQEEGPAPQQTTEAQRREGEVQERMAAMAVEQRRLEIGQRRKTELLAYELEKLQTYFERWSQVCAICMARTRAVEKGHGWEECPEADTVQLQDMHSRVQWLETVPFQPYARCTFCWAPQAICNSWEEKMRVQGAFQRRKNGSCQYVNVLKHAVAALLVFQGRTCMEWLEAQQKRIGLVHGSREERLGKWFGFKVKLSQREASQMCRFLYAWEAGQV
jgi:superfamily II DNA helicase RecQ